MELRFSESFQPLLGDDLKSTPEEMLRPGASTRP